MQSCTGARSHGKTNASCAGARHAAPDSDRDELFKETTADQMMPGGVLSQSPMPTRAPEIDSLVEMQSKSLEFHEAELLELRAQKMQIQEVAAILHAGVAAEDLKVVLSQIDIIGKTSANASHQLILELGTLKLEFQKQFQRQAEVMATRIATQQQTLMQSVQDMLDKTAVDREEIPSEGNARIIPPNTVPPWAHKLESGVTAAVIAELKHQRENLVEMLPELIEVVLKRHDANRASSLSELSRWHPVTAPPAVTNVASPSGKGKDAKNLTIDPYASCSSVASVETPRRASVDPTVPDSPSTDSKSRARRQVSTSTNSSVKAKLSNRLDLSQAADKAIVLRRKEKLQQTLMTNAEIEEKKAARASRISQAHTKWQKAARTDRQTIERYLDEVVCFMIVLNTALIGFSVDATIDGKWGPWQVIDILFALFFVIEFVIKVALHGPMKHWISKHHRTGKSQIEYLNIFDTVVVFFDTAQVVIGLVNFRKSGTTRVATLFRLVRLIRILKMLRVLRAKAMKGLVDMLQGVVHGSLTLSWAMVLFVFAVYVLGVFCRVMIGRDGWFVLHGYFDGVPRSMFTIFRCSFGDCTTRDGTSIPEVINRSYGGTYSLVYCGFIFFISVGLFNTISAIFVESTVTAATDLAEKKRQARLHDPERYATSTAVIIRGLISASTEPECQRVDLNDLVGFLDDIVQIEFSRDFFDEVILSNHDIMLALHKLDIEQQDHKRLSDILDPDHSGTIGMLELVEGLRRLRGAPSRSDIVSVDLMMRSLQEKVDDLCEALEKLPQPPRL